jgi:hypothetical protein
MREVQGSACQIDPIDDGAVAQAIVRYTGGRQGRVSYRGPATGNRYRFDSIDPCRWVHDADLDHFRRLQDFAVLEETRLRPSDAEIRRLIDKRVRVELAMLTPLVSKPHKALSKPGRPRIPDEDLLLLHHLNKHTTRKWTLAHLAFQFAPNAENPVATIKQRLHRARQRGILDQVCASCAQGHDPPPPESK